MTPPTLNYSGNPSLQFSADPVHPKEEIDAIVQQVPDKEQESKAVPSRPISGCAAETQRTGLQFFFEELG